MDFPLTLNDNAIALHELYTAYLKAGFNESQAFTLVQSILVSALTNYNGGQPG